MIKKKQVIRISNDKEIGRKMRKRAGKCEKSTEIKKMSW